MPQLLKNNVSGVLANELSAVATSMTLVDASSFPDPGSDYYLCTLAGFDSNGREDKWEIVRVTAKASNTLTITRAQEGTTNRLWPAASVVQMRLTAGSVATPDALATKQTLDADLTAIAALAGTTGLLKKTAANTWVLDTTSYSTLALGTSAGAALAASGAAGSATTAAKSDHVHPFPTAANVGAEPAITKSTGFAKWTGSAWSFDNSTYLTSAAVGVTLQGYDADLTAIAALAGTSGLLKKTAADTWVLDTTAYTANTGTVTSVAVSVPTGLAVSGSPVTSSGTIAIALASGYSIPTTAKQTNWDTAYGWGNHASAGYSTLVLGTSAGAALAASGAAGSATTAAKSDHVHPFPTAANVGAVAASGGTASGLTLNDGYTEEVFTVTGTAPALSPTNGSIQTWALTGNATPTAGTWASGQSMTLMVDDGSAYTINWASISITWKTGGGTAPTLLTTGYTVIELVKVGSTIYGWLAGDA